MVNLSPAVADELGLDPFAGTGVLVTNAGAGLARNIGLQRGDIVREVNGQKIVSVRDLAAVIASPARAWRVTVERNGRLLTQTFSA